jgi:uncharacterized membrane protein YhaH (DUF805 family)
MNWLFGFSGRMTRLDWWLAQLINLAVLVVLGVILVSVGAAAQLAEMSPAEGGGAGIGLSMVLVIVAAGGLMCWINIASTIKRFHDRNKSGFWVLIIFVPYIGTLWQIVECGFLAGTPGGNDYGSGGSGGGSRDLEAYANQLAAEYGRSPRASAEAPRAAAAVARVQTTSVPQSPRRAPQSGFGRRGTA